MPLALGFDVADVRPHSEASTGVVEEDTLGSLPLLLAAPRPVVSAAVSVPVNCRSPLTGWGRLPDTENSVAVSSEVHDSLAFWINVSTPHESSDHLGLLVPGSVTLLGDQLEVVSSHPDVEVDSLGSLVSAWSVPGLSWVLVPLLGVLPVVGQHPGTGASENSRSGVLNDVDFVSPTTSFSSVVASSGSAKLLSLSQTVSDEALASAVRALHTEDTHSGILGGSHASVLSSLSASKRANILWHSSSSSRLSSALSATISPTTLADHLLLGSSTSGVVL